MTVSPAPKLSVPLTLRYWFAGRSTLNPGATVTEAPAAIAKLFGNT